MAMMVASPQIFFFLFCWAETPWVRTRADSKSEAKIFFNLLTSLMVCSLYYTSEDGFSLVDVDGNSVTPTFQEPSEGTRARLSELSEVTCPACHNELSEDSRYCWHCGCPQRMLEISSKQQLRCDVFPTEVEELYINLKPTGVGPIETRWEVEHSSNEPRWLRLPRNQREVRTNQDSVQRLLIYGRRLPETESHFAHVRLHHDTKAGQRLDTPRLWDRWCWETSRFSVDVNKKRLPCLLANQTEIDLGLLSQVASLQIPQLFRFGNGGNAPLNLVITSHHKDLRPAASQLSLVPGQHHSLGGELRLLELAVDTEHEMRLEVTSTEEKLQFDFWVRFRLQVPRVSLPVLGVDFGTSTSKVALLGDGQIRQIRLDGRELFPSHLYLHADGRMVIGADAAEYRGEPNYLRNLKSLINTDASWVEVLDITTGERIRHDLYALVAGFLRRLFKKARESEDFQRYAGVGVTAKDVRLVLTIPAGSNQQARSELRTLMTKILERLGFAEVTILVEPTAVSYLYAAEDPEMVEGKRILVFDCGAGTTDVSLLKVRLARDPEEGYFFRLFDILGESGEMIGGNLFDVALYDKLVSLMGPNSKARLRKLLWQQQEGSTGQLNPPDDFPGKRKIRSQLLLEAVRQTKENLSLGWKTAQPEFLVHCPEAIDPAEQLALTRPQLVGALKSYFGKLEALCGRVIRESRLEEDDIDRVYLVGGSSFLPPLKSFLTRVFGHDKVVTDQARLTSISRGAVASASTRIRRVLTSDFILRVPGIKEQRLVTAGAIYPTPIRSRVLLAPSSPPFYISFTILKRPSPALSPENAQEIELGTLEVRVDEGKSREITLEYSIDQHGSLTILARYGPGKQSRTFPLRYPQPIPRRS